MNDILTPTCPMISHYQHPIVGPAPDADCNDERQRPGSKDGGMSTSLSAPSERERGLGTPLAVRPVRGMCFGYEIRSELSFNYLRPGTGTPLHVYERDLGEPEPIGELLTESSDASDRGGGQVDVYAAGSAYHISVGHAGWFHVDLHVPLHRRA